MSPSREFRLLWLGRSMSALGDFVIPAALAIAVVRATDSAAALGLVLACATVPRLLLLPLGGVLGDRWQPRRVALFADLVRVATQLVIAIELISGVFRLTDLAVAAALAGAASAFALPTTSPLVAATVSDDGRARANSLLGVSRGVATWNFAAAVLLTLGPVIALRELGGEAVWVAVLQAGALGLLGGSLVATRLGGPGRFRVRVDRPVLVANLSLALYAAPLLLLALAAPAPAVIGAYALALAGLGFLNPVWGTAVQRHVPADRLARVTAYDILVSIAAMPLGYALAPVAADALGAAAPLGMAAFLVFVTTAGTALVPAVRNLRSDLPAAPPAAAPPVKRWRYESTEPRPPVRVGAVRAGRPGVRRLTCRWAAVAAAPAGHRPASARCRDLGPVGRPAGEAPAG